jgi:hypothetical protein
MKNMGPFLKKLVVYKAGLILYTFQNDDISLKIITQNRSLHGF